MGDIVADLHTHSTYSDGLYTPEALYKHIVNKGIKTFSLTDHDNIGGLASLKNFKDITFIPGVELTATHSGKEIHMLGYYINPDNPHLVETVGKIVKRRRERLLDIVDNLNRSGKVIIDRDEFSQEISEGSCSRLNLARFMVKKRVVSSIDQCFSRYIGETSRAYMPVDFFSPEEAVKLVHEAGGLAFLAHPGTLNVPGIIPELVEYGLDGIEVFHPSHGPNDVQRCLEWAVRFKLGVSGGSDFHGNADSPRQVLSVGLDGERLVEFLALRPNRDMVTV